MMIASIDMEVNDMRCNRTRKVRYKSELGANLAMARIAMQSSRHRAQRHKEIPSRSYECQFCKGWHLTKQDKESSD